MFAASFLQIPLRSGHLCSWLMIRTATLIRDLHPIAYNHAWRTIEMPVNRHSTVIGVLLVSNAPMNEA